MARDKSALYAVTSTLPAAGASGNWSPPGIGLAFAGLRLGAWTLTAPFFWPVSRPPPQKLKLSILRGSHTRLDTWLLAAQPVGRTRATGRAVLWTAVRQPAPIRPVTRRRPRRRGRPCAGGNHEHQHRDERRSCTLLRCAHGHTPCRTGQSAAGGAGAAAPPALTIRAAAAPICSAEARRAGCPGRSPGLICCATPSRTRRMNRRSTR